MSRIVSTAFDNNNKINVVINIQDLLDLNPPPAMI